MNNSTVKNLCDGVSLRCIEETKFKKAGIMLSIIIPLDREKAAGRALVPYILGNSCRRYPDMTELNRRLAMMYGAEVTPMVNRVGDMHRLSLVISCLDERYTIGKENIIAGCGQLLCDMLFDPMLIDGAFRSEDVAREKRLQIQRLETQRSDKQGWAYEQCIETMFRNEPCGVNPMGTEEQVSALTAEQVTELYRELIETAIIDITAVGVMDFDGIESIFRAAFAKISRRPIDKPQQIIIESAESRKVIERSDVQQANMVIGYRMKKQSNRVVGKLLSCCLGATAHSRFFKRIREELSLCYYCSSSFTRAKNIMLVNSGLMPDKLEQAMTEIQAQISDVANGGLTEEELASAKLSLKNSYCSVEDSLFSLMVWYGFQVLDDTVITPNDAMELADKITSEEICRAAGELYEDTIYIVMPEVAQ